MIVAAALLTLAAFEPDQTPPDQSPGVSRTELQQHDLSIAGWQTVQTRVDFAPGAVSPRHMHPGEEVIYVLKGTIEYRLDGQPRVTLNAGDTLFIPKGKPHEAVKVGLEPASELATYVLEKGKPMVVAVP
jgi:quercetin dioxygenase-like cupin family protein